MKKIKNILIIVSTIAISIIIPFTSKYIVGLMGSFGNENSLMVYVLKSIVFYALQTGMAILVVRYLLKYSISDMGFNLKNWKTSIKYVLKFSLIWLILDILFYLICIKYMRGFDSYIAYYYVKDSNNLLKDILVGCMMAGIGEEPLFRGLIILILSPVITNQLNLGKIKLPLLALFSGFIFMLAHIVYEISPFRVVRIDYMQLFLTFLLGTTWATIFIKTKSLLGPIMAHSFANTIQIMSGYFVAFLIL